jgi:sugar/nucleoside kinase (ribokinase family)
VILSVGDLLLDVLLLPELQEEEQRAGIAVRGGGSAANTAAWVEHLGYPTRFVGCVGDDPLGAMLRSELRDAGVQTAVRTVAGAETGCVAVGVTPAGERVMRSARGANEALSPGDIRRAASPDLAAVHLTGYALLGPYGLELLEAAGETARAAGALLSFDPSSRGVVNRFGSERLLEDIRRLGVDLLLPSRPEAEALTGTAGAAEAALGLATFARMAVVKDGERGAAVSAGGETQEVPTEPVRPVDSTGAGDAFNAGLLVGLVRGAGLGEACAFAHTVARDAISRYGGRPPRRL